MRHIYFLLSIFVAVSVQAQQFSHLYFEDKNGLKDSLQIAVCMSDDEFTGVQLTEAEQALFDSTYWVMLKDGRWEGEGNKWESYHYIWSYSRVYTYKPYTGWAETKKQSILIPADRLPVTISWDKQFFNDNGLSNSVMWDGHSWFDVGCEDGDLESLESEVYLTRTDSCIIHYTYNEYVDPCSYEYLGGMLVKTIGLSLGTSSNILWDVEQTYSGISATKILRDGHIYIQRGDKTFNITGTEIK